MKSQKTTFALFFGNRGFFPGSLIASAREDMVTTLKKLGHDTLLLDAGATRHGAVETPEEGEVYARFLKEHAGEFGGVILCLPNFGDETGAAAALQDAGVPILIHAYPDELDKMTPELRRDAFCGKFSIMDVFCQYGIKFTALEPHTVSPKSADFATNIDYFDRLCRVVGALKKMRVGAIGARTTAFKTVRIDELALQKNGITMETFDLSDVFHRMQSVSASDASYMDKAQVLNCYSDFSNMPAKPFDNLVKLAVVIDAITQEAKLDAVALRCWIEMQQVLNISPCVLLSELNNRMVTAACELDVGNAVAMHALSKASGNSAACLDWNNNYGDDPDKCILFHCGPVPQSMMSTKGKVTDHAILANAVGPGCSFGCNVGRIAPTDFTFSSMMTDSGRLKFFVGEGKFTADNIPAEFFGCAGVAEIPNLQQVLLYVGRNGHRHHVSVTPSHVADPVKDALEYYLGFDVASPQIS
ncbi:MAG: L-fucose/L-arabinose isomerase family protein [Armatimonadota bacterium]